MTEQVNEEALASITLGETYVDGITGLSGAATDKLASMHDMPRVCLANDTGSHWFPLSRIINEEGEPVIGEFTIPHSSTTTSKNAVTH